METKVITITNEKGGVGKTTTSLELSTGLVQKGFKVLAIDLDTQCNLSLVTTGKTQFNSPSIGDVLSDKYDLEDAVIHLPTGLDLIRGSRTLSYDVKDVENLELFYKLNEVLENQDNYDYVVIDTPPAITEITTSAFIASTDIIIPVHAELFSLKGTLSLSKTIKSAQKRMSRPLKISGILLCKYKEKTAIARAVSTQFDELAKTLETKIFTSKIRDSVIVQEAQLSHKSVLEYSPKSPVGEDYKSFIEEYLRG